jgi:hypothetical protein
MAETLPIEIAPTAAAASKLNVTFFIAKPPFLQAKAAANGFRFKSVQTPASEVTLCRLSDRLIELNQRPIIGKAKMTEIRWRDVGY